MTKKPFEADDYTISVKREMVDDELVFVARVEEFPDVIMYGESRDEAISLAHDSLTTLIEMSAEMGHALPTPLLAEELSYSGRITLRMGKHLHRKIAHQAGMQGVSLNQYIVERIAEENGKDQASRVSYDILTGLLDTAGTKALPLPHTFSLNKNIIQGFVGASIIPHQTDMLGVHLRQYAAEKIDKENERDQLSYGMLIGLFNIIKSKISPFSSTSSLNKGIIQSIVDTSTHIEENSRAPKNFAVVSSNDRLCFKSIIAH